MELREWLKSFLQSKAAQMAEMAQVKENSDGYDFVVVKKNTEQLFKITPNIEQTKDLDVAHQICIVTLNTKANLNALIKKWDEFVKYRNVCVYFVNPDAKEQKMWAVCPYTHDLITEKGMLAKGLNSLFSLVKEVA